MPLSSQIIQPRSYICKSCLRSLRSSRKPSQIPPFTPIRPPKHAKPHSFSTHASSYSSDTAAHAYLPTRRLIALTGQDAAHFLQGLTTVNITSHVQKYGGSGMYSAFLNAAGRVLNDVFIYPTAGSRAWRDNNTPGQSKGGGEADSEGFLIEVDANEVDTLAKHLKRFKLRAKVAIRVLQEEEWKVWSEWQSAERGGDIDKWEGAGTDEIGCVDSRAPGMGRRIILHRSSDGNHEGILTGDEVLPETYEIRRTMLGVPEGQGEIIKDSALPQESDIDYMGGIDFRKGCYVGQELTIRTHHTGVVRKRLLPVQIYAPGDSLPESITYDSGFNFDLPATGSSIDRVGKKGRSAGRWIGGVGNVGLALCRLEIMTNTALTGEGCQWTPQDEFKISGPGGEVRIKAFVPNWHHERAESQKIRRQ